MHLHEAYSLCRQYHYRYVRITMKDGSVYDGFIADVDRENVTLAIPIGEAEEKFKGKSMKGADYRQFGFFSRRRFRRRILPLALLSSVFLLPFFGGGYPYGGFPYGGYPYYY